MRLNYFNCLLLILTIKIIFVSISIKTWALITCSVTGILSTILYHHISVASSIFFIGENIIQYALSYKRTDITSHLCTVFFFIFSSVWIIRVDFGRRLSLFWRAFGFRCHMISPSIKTVTRYLNFAAMLILYIKFVYRILVCPSC